MNYLQYLIVMPQLLLLLFLLHFYLVFLIVFKEWTRDAVTKERIKQMWTLHFPHFPYDEFNNEVSTIYDKVKR